MISKFAGLGLAVATAARMTLLHPATGQPLRRPKRHADGQPVLDEKGGPVYEVAWIDVLSADSEAARAHEREAQNRRIRSRARRLVAEDLEAEGLELLVALTKGWSLATLENEPLDVPFSAENARELYSAPELAFIRRQVNDFAADAGNFQTPKTSSS
jgi:hypothetical protein